MLYSTWQGHDEMKQNVIGRTHSNFWLANPKFQAFFIIFLWIKNIMFCVYLNIDVFSQQMFDEEGFGNFFVESEALIVGPHSPGPISSSQPTWGLIKHKAERKKKHPHNITL